MQAIGPDQIVRAQHLEGALHLPLVEVAARCHQLLEKGDLVLVDEEAQLAGRGEIGLRGEQGERAQRRAAVAAERGGDDREQRAAEAVAGRVDADAGDDSGDRLQRGEHAELLVVVHAEVAIGAGRVLPRDREDGEAVVDEVADQRVAAARGRARSTS